MKTWKPEFSEIVTAQQAQQAAADAAWQTFRDERDRRLVSSDWTQVADAPVDADAWADYRQQLRDLPEATTDPSKPVWPTEPARTT